MVKEVRIYIEGGGDGKNTKQLLRQGFSSFFKELVAVARSYLMVQAMEAWLIADVDTLKRFYGQGFKENAIPKSRNVETIDKDLLERSLKTATRDTKSKGEYQKIQHAYQLLEMLDVDKVRKASLECDRIFATLTELMEQDN